LFARANYINILAEKLIQAEKIMKLEKKRVYENTKK